MSLQSLTLKAGGTIAVTGGTDVVYNIISRGTNSIKLGDASATDIRLQKTITIKTSSPRPNKGMPNGYTQAKVSIKSVTPKILANGNRTTDTTEILKSFDVETSAAQHVVLNDIIAQCGFDSELLPTLNLLSL